MGSCRSSWPAVLLASLISMLVSATARAEPPMPPRPGEAHGVEVEERKGAKALLWVPRVVLFVPHWALAVVAYPVRVGLDVYHRYALRDLFYDVFFNERRTFGLYPIGRLESGFGANLGARMVHRDLFRRGGDLSAQANFGQNFGRRVDLRLDTGDALPRGLLLGFKAQYRLVPGDIFVGIGNARESEPGTVPGPIDPLVDETAVLARFSHEYVRGAIELAQPLGNDPVRLRLGHLWTWRRFGRSQREDERTHLEDVYDPRGLVGYDDGLINAYTEVRLEYDTRSNPARVSVAAPASGWWIQTWAGYAEGLAHDPSRYGRFGADVQRFIDLWGGDRVLRLRGLVEGVAGDIERVPFVALPTMGGPYFGRGYLRDRFRDRVVTMGTFEYQYPVHFRINAYLFVEPTLTARHLGEFDLPRMHLGYGGGFQVQTMHKFLARLLIASSIEGGLFFHLNLSPAERERKHY